MILLILLVLYWFITVMIHLGISAANIEDEEVNIPIAFCESVFLGWVFVPIFIGEALGLYIHKAIKDRYS